MGSMHHRNGQCLSKFLATEFVEPFFSDSTKTLPRSKQARVLWMLMPCYAITMCYCLHSLVWWMLVHDGCWRQVSRTPLPFVFRAKYLPRYVPVLILRNLLRTLDHSHFCLTSSHNRRRRAKATKQHEVYTISSVIDTPPGQLCVRCRKPAWIRWPHNCFR